LSFILEIYIFISIKKYVMKIDNRFQHIKLFKLLLLVPDPPDDGGGDDDPPNPPKP
jgi:hypothetical protein